MHIFGQRHCAKIQRQKLSVAHFLRHGFFVSFRLNRTAAALFLALTVLTLSAARLVPKKAAEAAGESRPSEVTQQNTAAEKSFIKWVDFGVTQTAMNKAMKLDIESADKTPHLDWIELLSVLAVKYGGDFGKFREKDLTALADRLRSGETIEEITGGMKYYSYFHDAYSAVLGEYLGEYSVRRPTENGGAEWVREYGLKAFSPIARGYGYSHYDDFGVSRTYGYKRRHLGHDMMGNVGTPIIAIESGRVEALGWNQYGGWRLGIRSFDGKRYYYYAHLRKNHPYPQDLAQGQTVKAGDVIGYLGMTGYSSRENVNNIDTPHLHMGIQLIFDESQKDGNGEIWIDCYEIAQFLAQNTSAVTKCEETGEYMRKYDFFENSVENIE